MGDCRWVVCVLVLSWLGCGDDDAPPPEQASPAAPPSGEAPQAGAAPASADAAPGDVGDGGGSEEAAAAAEARERAEANTRRLKGYQQWAMGRSLAAEEQIDNAVQAYEEAQANLPDDGWLRLELAKLCHAQSRHDCAATQAEQAIDRAEKNVSLLARANEVLGLARKDLNDRVGARKALVNALKHKPNAEIVSKIKELDENPMDEDSSSTLIACPGAGPESQRAAAALEGTPLGRDRSVCPLLDSPYEDVSAGGQVSEIHIMASLAAHRKAGEALLDQAGLGVSGAFTLALVRTSNGQANIIKINDGFRNRQNEILSELSATARRVTLGPSRPALAVKLSTRGWRPVSRKGPSYSFERSELFLVGRHGNREKTLAHQITLDRHYEVETHCWLGKIAVPKVETGSIWLEDLDLNGVPEICQEERESLGSLPLWLGHDSPELRKSASCQRWVASDLGRAPQSVPSLNLDDMERGRSVSQILEVSRIPTQLRHAFQKHLRNKAIIAAKNMKLARTGMSALAVVAGDTSVQALAVSAGDEVNTLPLGPVGRWRHLTAAIDITDPRLIVVRVSAQGLESRPGSGDPGGARQWLHLIASNPGVPPMVALTAELGNSTPLSTSPCPTITEGSYERQDQNRTPFMVIKKTTRTGPGRNATTRANQSECQQFDRWLKAPLEGAREEADNLPPTAEDLCPIGLEHLPAERYSPSPDGRFVKTTLP